MQQTDKQKSNSQSKSSATAFGAKLLKPYKKHLVFGIISLIIVDIADVLPPLILKFAIDSLEVEGEFRTLVYCGLTIIVVALIQGLFRFFWRQFFLGSSHKASYDLRKMLFAHLLKLPFSYFNKTRVGDMMSRLTSDIQEIRFMLGVGILVALDATFYIFTVPFIMIWLSPWLTFITALPFLLIPVSVLVIKGAIHYYSKEVQARLSDLSSRAEENMSSIRVVKGFCSEKTEIERFDECGRGYVRDRLKLAIIESFILPVLEISVAVGIIILLYFGGHMVINGEISLGDFIAFQYYLFKLSWPMMAIGWIINLYQRSVASMERCKQILDEPEFGIDSEKQPIELSEGLPGDIVIENLNFKYPSATHDTLKNINFRIKQGQTIGITGPVGSGKTTLLRLLMRTYDYEQGRILVGSQELKNIKLEDVRKLFSYVPQDTFLFSETIRENILFASENREDTERAAQYANTAGLTDEIKMFPEKLDTLLGERGVNLSGGQKQRVSLARALATQRPILILDDCTSAVDTETEKQILDVLAQEKQKRTCIIVSHRIVSLVHADAILYIKDGQIVELGSHEELIKINGLYAKACKRQKIESELEQEKCNA